MVTLRKSTYDVRVTRGTRVLTTLSGLGTPREAREALAREHQRYVGGPATRVEIVTVPPVARCTHQHVHYPFPNGTGCILTPAGQIAR